MMVGPTPGQPVSVNAELQDEYSATPAEAVSKIEAAMEEWVKNLRRRASPNPTAPLCAKGIE